MCNQLLKMAAAEEIWNPCENLFSKHKTGNYGIILLNTCFQFNPGFLLNLWNQAKVRITVDGGTEKWLSWLAFHNIDQETVVAPELITGDMDSVSQDVLEKFTNSKIVKTPDQDETDFTKSLKELHRFCINDNIEILDAVYVIADTCGRLDQILGNIHTLHKASEILDKIKLFQVATNSLTWLLDEGQHIIQIPSVLRDKKEWCALIPFRQSCVTTTGLKWNLNKTKTELGGLLSTSNTYDNFSSKVTVQTNNALVWSMGITSLLETT